MKWVVTWTIVGIIAVAVTAILFGDGCAPPPQLDPAVGNYLVEGHACIKRARTLEESRACREQAKRDNGLVRDAGEDAHD